MMCLLWLILLLPAWRRKARRAKHCRPSCARHVSRCVIVLPFVVLPTSSGAAPNACEKHPTVLYRLADAGLRVTTAILVTCNKVHSAELCWPYAVAESYRRKTLNTHFFVCFFSVEWHRIGCSWNVHTA